MLPEGMKSLAEIEDIEERAVRVSLLDTLFEYLLREVTPNSQGLAWWKLIKANKDLQTFRAKFQLARDTRNAKTHGKAFTPDDILIAGRVYRLAIDQVLSRCPPGLASDIMGTPRPPNDSAASNSRRAEEPKRPEFDGPTPKGSRAGDGQRQETERRESAGENSRQSASRREEPISAPIHPLLRVALGGLAVLAALFVVSILYTVGSNRPPDLHRNQPGPTPSENQGAVVPAASADRPVRTIPPQSPERADDLKTQFTTLVNSRVTLSSLRPNVALVIDAPKQTGAISIADLLSGFLNDEKVHIVLNLVNPEALKERGFFDDFFSGNGSLLRDAARISNVDYILLGRADYGFRKQQALDPDLITCDLNLNVEVADRQGTISRSAAFHVAGPGFTEAEAIEGAAKNAARQLTIEVLGALP